jgi:hypothetical protein
MIDVETAAMKSVAHDPFLIAARPTSTMADRAHKRTSTLRSADLNRP